MKNLMNTMLRVLRTPLRMPLALRRSGRVLLSYGAFTAWGLICLVASVLLILGEQALPAITESILLTIGGICVATLVGHLLGNLIALMRLRMWVVVAIAGAAAIGVMMASAALGPLTGFFIVAGLAAGGGYFGVASRMDIVAAWLPLSYAVGAAVIWMNNHQKVSIWLTGAKFAVWDAITFVFLTGAVLLFLVYLMTRHALALTLWQAAARPGGDVVAALDVDARAGRGSLGVIFGLTGLVLVATAVVSPFLFRTRAVEGSQMMSASAESTQWNGPSSYTTTRSKVRPPPIVYDTYGTGGYGTGGYGTGGYGGGYGSTRYSNDGWGSGGAYTGSGKYTKGKGSKGSKGKGKAVRGKSSKTNKNLAMAQPKYTPPPPRAEPPPPPKEPTPPPKEPPPKEPPPKETCVPGQPGFDPACLLTLKVAGAQPPTATTTTTTTTTATAASDTGAVAGGALAGGDVVAGTAGVGTVGTGTVGTGTVGTGTGTIGTGDIGTAVPSTIAPLDTGYANIDPSMPQPNLQRARDKSIDVAKIGAVMLAALVSLLALLLLLLAVFYRPLRRAVLLRHLESPLWRTPPTRRVENLWLRALIALEDVGIQPRPNESPQKLAARARDELTERHGAVPAGVEAAAQIIERVEYAGRGLSVDEEAKMRAAVRTFLAYISSHLATGKKIALGWATVRAR